MRRQRRVALAGALLAVLSVLGFSLKAILVKIAYAHHPIDAVTLLTLRMLYSMPLFAIMGWWALRQHGLAKPWPGDWLRLLWLGFIGYYISSLLDFLGLERVTAAFERLVLFLYPTIVVLLSAALRKTPITLRTAAALALSYGGVVLVFVHDLLAGANPSGLWIGGAMVLGSAFTYSLFLVQATDVIARLGSMRFIAWAMLASTIYIVVHFGLTHPVQALAVPTIVHVVALAMAVFATVLPTWCLAEALRRIGPNESSLVGSLGPVFTIALAAAVLDEPFHWTQAAGAALVLIGVMLVTMRPATRTTTRA